MKTVFKPQITTQKMTRTQSISYQVTTLVNDDRESQN